MISPLSAMVGVADPDEPGEKKKKRARLRPWWILCYLSVRSKDEGPAVKEFTPFGKEISSSRQILVDNEDALDYISLPACENRQSRRGMEQLGSSSGS